MEIFPDFFEKMKKLNEICFGLDDGILDFEGRNFEFWHPFFLSRKVC